MGEYADVKLKNIRRLLNWLKNKPHFEVNTGGKHNYSIKYTYGKRPFPIPFKHNVVNKYIVKDLVKRLVKWEAGAKEEIDGFF